MAQDVTLMMASRGCSIFGSGTLSQRMSCLPCQHRAFMGNLGSRTGGPANAEMWDMFLRVGEGTRGLRPPGPSLRGAERHNRRTGLGCFAPLAIRANVRP